MATQPATVTDKRTMMDTFLFMQVDGTKAEILSLQPKSSGEPQIPDIDSEDSVLEIDDEDRAQNFWDERVSCSSSELDGICS